MRVTAFFAMALVLGASAVGATPSPPAALAPSPRAPRVATSTRAAIAPHAAPRPRAVAPATWGEALGPIEVLDRNTDARATIRLYRDDGLLDRDALRSFGAGAGPDRLDARLVQLALRAAYHFGGARIEIVSATRKGARGKHGHGEALDFALTGVRASALAAYLRGTPLAGVGVYTHPKTQYVHLDVRDRSFHWIDASPPGVTWREQRLSDPRQAARDASYVPAMDLPEPASR